MRRAHIGMGALLALTVWTTSACGSEAEPAAAGEETTAPAADGEDATAEPVEEAAVEEEEPASLERAAFCDKVTDDVVTAALGAPAQWEVSRVPGDTFTVIVGEKEKEKDFLCSWQTNAESEAIGAGDAIFAIRMGGKAMSAAAVEKTMAAELKVRSSYQECEEETSPFVVDPTAASSCVQAGDEYNEPRATAQAGGLFGDVHLTCYVAHLGKDTLPAVRAAFESSCAQVPALLGS